MKSESRPLYRVGADGSVYEWDEGSQAYLFIGKLNGKTLKQFLHEYWMSQIGQGR